MNQLNQQAQLAMVGQMLASLVDMAKGQLGDQFAVSIIARHKTGPFHMLLGDDNELALQGCLGELSRMGTDLVRDGQVVEEPERSVADRMFDLLNEVRDHIEAKGATAEADDVALSAKISELLEPDATRPIDRGTKDAAL